MIDVSRSAEKPTEVIGVSFNVYNELICISTKVDIVVDLMCHGTLMAEEILKILKVETSLLKETTFESYIAIPVYFYNNLIDLKVRVDVLLDMLEKKDYAPTDKILRTLGTELAIEEADRQEKELNERFNNK